MWIPALADSERHAFKRADCVGASRRGAVQALTQRNAHRTKLRLHTGRLSAGRTEPSVIALHNAHDDRDASGPLSPRAIAIGRHGHALARSKCVAFAPCLIASVASVERRDAREGSNASEARTARGRQCFERMNGGIIGGFVCVCQVKSFQLLK